MKKDRIILEACCADIESVKAAKTGGADRIELCTALEMGGLTPSYGLIKQAVEIYGKGVMVLIRPRPGDFHYTADEINVMIDDIRICESLGAGGVVVGALTADGKLDKEACKKMIEAAGKMEPVLHRAFDRTSNAIEALDDAIALGFVRILTSGQMPTAYDGRHKLKELNLKSNGRITLLAGAGVNPQNVVEIINDSGCRQVHASAKCNVPSGMIYQNPNLTKAGDKTGYNGTSKEIIEEIVEKISDL